MDVEDLKWLALTEIAVEGRELEYVSAAVAAGRMASGGKFSEACARILSEELQARGVLLTTSCTDALEMAAMLLEIQPGDVVVVPSFTFVSTALAFVRAGASVRFADIERDTLGLDPNSVEALLDDRVRAVIPIHYAGIPCRIRELVRLLNNVPRAELIEDNAHGLFGRLEGQPLGSFGRLSTLSFHETKNFVCGEGGALVMNHTDDLERAQVILDKGTNRSQFFQGLVDKYTWVDSGSSFGLSDALAGFLLGQLEAKERILASRARVHSYYRTLLDGAAEAYTMRLPPSEELGSSAFHMFYLLMPSMRVRDHVLNRLREARIRAAFHYVPLHSSPFGRSLGAHGDSCPVATDISERLLRLPFHSRLTEEQCQRVADEVIQAVEECQ